MEVLEGRAMQVVHPVCGGTDVHQAPLTACLRRVTEEGQVTQEVRGCAAPDPALLAWLGWLSARHCPVVVMRCSSGMRMRGAAGAAGSPTRRMPAGSPHSWPMGWSDRASCLPRQPRAARPDAHPRGPCPDPESGQASGQYTAGGHEHQALPCRGRPVRGQWPAHARRLDR
jgi:hypothetical protein